MKALMKELEILYATNLDPFSRFVVPEGIVYEGVVVDGEAVYTEIGFIKHKSLSKLLGEALEPTAHLSNPKIGMGLLCQKWSLSGMRYYLTDKGIDWIEQRVIRRDYAQFKAGDRVVVGGEIGTVLKVSRELAKVKFDYGFVERNPGMVSIERMQKYELSRR